MSDLDAEHAVCVVLQLSQNKNDIYIYSGSRIRHLLYIYISSQLSSQILLCHCKADLCFKHLILPSCNLCFNVVDKNIGDNVQGCKV